jgi:pseudaminic acid synthase
MNLLTLVDMKERFGTEVGLSDHTLGNDAVIASVALGARVIEKHFTPDENIETPDGAFSLSPSQLKEMVQSVRNVEKMLGSIKYDDKPKKYARSLYASRDIKKGESFTKENVKSIRPGDGLHPKYYDALMHKTTTIDIKAGTALQWSFIND